MIKDVFASIVGSAACVYTGQPFDTIKVRMQVQTGEFKSALHCFQKTIKKEGIAALWKGSVPAFMGALGENAVGFAVNGELKRIVATFDSSPWLTSIQPYLIGSITGACSATVLCPSDVIKCRAQMSRMHGGSGSMTDIIRQTLQKQGPLGLYTGFTSQLLRDVPFYASFFGTYDSGCKILRKMFPHWPDAAIYFMSGGLAGQMAWIVATPSDVIKSIVQTSPIHVTARQTAANILKTQGMRGFFNGMSVAVVRAFPANAALFLGYELARKVLP
jgi:solute carrier family 25 ornithine transporter 2/15